MTARSWTDAEDDVLRAGIDEGATYRIIADRLSGRTLMAVAARCYRLGLVVTGHHKHADGKPHIGPIERALAAKQVRWLAEWRRRESNK